MKKVKVLLTVFFCFIVFLPTKIWATEKEFISDDFGEVNFKFCPINNTPDYETRVLNLYDDDEDRYLQLYTTPFKPDQEIQTFVWPYGVKVKIICGGNWSEVSLYGPTWIVIY